MVHGHPLAQVGADIGLTGDWHDQGGEGQLGEAHAERQLRSQMASTSGDGGIELPRMPWSDWLIQEDEIRICLRQDGTPWELGNGAFGKVGVTSFATAP
jgi:hypothetical protein